MLFNVPQYIDIEDKVAGPLTAKQLGWMGLMFVIHIILWTSTPNKAIFFIAAIPVSLFFIALAFVKPYGQTLVSLLIAGIKFSLFPKVYVWRRTGTQTVTTSMKAKQDIAKEEKKIEATVERKKEALKNLKDIASIIDSKGENADQNVVSFLRKSQTKK